MTSSLFKSVCFGPEKGHAYAVTSRGQEELGGASTALTAAEIELLVRLEEQLQSQLSAFSESLGGEEADAGLLSLRRTGYFVRLAANRAEVSAQLSKPQVPDVVLLDVMLPDADGFDILRRIRKHPALREVPVIMLTGMATRGDVIRGMQGGADGYVTKPFEAEALMRALRTVLGLAAPPAKSADPWKNADSKAPRGERQPA
jgi:CheY-like chemotaxis protein